MLRFCVVVVDERVNRFVWQKVEYKLSVYVQLHEALILKCSLRTVSFIATKTSLKLQGKRQEKKNPTWTRQEKTEVREFGNDWTL